MGQKKDCIPGDSTSDSSERLLPSSRGGQYIYGCGEGGIHAMKHIFFQKVSASLVKITASHEEHVSLCFSRREELEELDS